ncbi:hypothetical protein [Variovorax sp. PCZ-1]|uniref:hypothetical protein n=1 Tax=Variovorax sp. PCZ-1 TaxID=2835533 RepID=UPI001BCCAFB1|nr:hypothetical protein [Variovorax sp. PCZ-1]MBS7806894.1 hypothetical protein [Variovorax sp. PCZ-1]
MVAAAADLPAGVIRAEQRARKLIAKRALVAAAAGAVPLPGLDWAVDAALLSKLIPQINEEFGLAPHQIAKLPVHQRERVQTAIALVGGALLGKLITKSLIIRAMKAVGVRLTAAQAAKFVPLAGQAASAALNYAALRWLGEQHIKDCLRVVQEAKLQLIAPAH